MNVLYFEIPDEDECDHDDNPRKAKATHEIGTWLDTYNLSKHVIIMVIEQTRINYYYTRSMLVSQMS